MVNDVPLTDKPRKNI